MHAGVTNLQLVALQRLPTTFRTPAAVLGSQTNPQLMSPKQTLL